ncbi:hypothetical protein AB5I39_08775 [Sphingomonas sp. MMS24-J45]|uniref:hypothetical protein n=1 Tax=Sphingomonas sp. MMS24-J45 TaxID=3238806 RepID=UPI00384F580B
MRLRSAKNCVMVRESSPIDEQRTSVAEINAQTGLGWEERTFQVARDNLALRTGQSVITTLDQSWFDGIRTYGSGSVLPQMARWPTRRRV